MRSRARPATTRGPYAPSHAVLDASDLRGNSRRRCTRKLVGSARRAPTDPGYWVGLSIGYVDGITTTDEATGATWAFGYTSQFRATAEKTLSQGVTFGVAAGYASAPLTYRSATSFNGDCPGSCLANADITQYLAFVRGGGGPAGTGFRGTFSGEGGVTQFSKFRDRTTKTLTSAGVRQLRPDTRLRRRIRISDVAPVRALRRSEL